MLCDIVDVHERHIPRQLVTQVRKGLLELSVLNALSEAKRYGYDIVKTLRGGNGLVMTEGTIYPILNRFRREGLVRTAMEPSPDGPDRRYYTLTPGGRKVLARMNAHWRQIRRWIDSTMNK